MSITSLVRIFVIIESFCVFLVSCQSISVTFSFLRGSTTNPVAFARYPSSYGVFSTSNRPGPLERHKIVAINGLIYSFLGFPDPNNVVWAFNGSNKSWAWMSGMSNNVNPNYGNFRVPLASNVPGSRSEFGGDFHRARGEYIVFGGFDISGRRGDLWSYSVATNMWSWLSGSSSSSEAVNYGIRGTASASTTPGARGAVSCVVHVPTGEFLLFGGYNTTAIDYKGDVWTFNFVWSQWTWIAGTSTATNPIVGPKSQFSTSYAPARRCNADLAFDPSSNLVFLFGGYGISDSIWNDVWAFRRETLEWAWFRGGSASSQANYGIRGKSSPSTTPGARASHSMTFHDFSGLLLVFGGSGEDKDGTFGLLGDLWAYNVTSTEWTWISGSSVANAAAVYAGALSNPAAVQYGTITVDHETGAIYMFGGDTNIVSDSAGALDHFWLASLSARNIATRISVTTSQPLPSSYLTSRVSLVSIDTLSICTSSRNSALPTTTVGILALSLRLSQDSSSASTSTFSDLEIAVAARRKSLISFKTSPQLKRDVSFERSSQSFITSSIAKVVFLSTTLLVVSLCILAGIKYTRPRTSYPDAGKSKGNQVQANVGYATSTMLSITETSQMTMHRSTISSTGYTTATNTTIAVYMPGGLQLAGNTSYRIEREIARGGGGAVCLAIALLPSLKVYGQTVVVKLPNTDMSIESELAKFQQEIALLNAFKAHTNIVRLLGYSEYPHSIILKYYPRGSLLDWISRQKRTVSLVYNFITDISHGVLALHKNGVVHCDIKPENVLIDEGGRLFAVLTDFGISQIVTDKLLKVGAYQVQHIDGASIAYASPEVIRGLRKSSRLRVFPLELMARDVYALGMVTSILLRGRQKW